MNVMMNTRNPDRRGNFVPIGSWERANIDVQDRSRSHHNKELSILLSTICLLASQISRVIIISSVRDLL
jgi:hypothetical protein